MTINYAAVKYLPGMPVLARLFLFAALMLLVGCASVPRPSDLKYVNGAMVDTLSGNVSLSYMSTDRSISGSGVLMYRKPDQMRGIILSPFGSVLQEVYVSGERVTVIDSGNGVAFSGTRDDLPRKGTFSGWRHLQWVTDLDRPDSAAGTREVERTNRFGETEKAAFENGLLISKSTAVGGRAKYENYAVLQGAPFPMRITYETPAGESFTIAFEDPEVNIPLAGNVFSPDLGKLRVYPLSSLK